MLLTGDDHVTEVDTVVGGTGEWAGTTGAIRAQGTFSATSGGGGDYVGQLCTP